MKISSPEPAHLVQLDRMGAFEASGWGIILLSAHQIKYATIAQLVEHTVHTREVFVGSTPTRGTISRVRV